jgi:hypothetical protein
MGMIRPDPANDRDSIRRAMDIFLAGIQTSNYALLNGISGSSLLTEAGAYITEELPAPDPNLTWALSAALPMTLSTTDVNGNRIQITLLINPSSVNHGKTSSTNATYTRGGFVTQLWGPNQDLITSTGTTAAFMVEGTGLTAVSRTRSFAYKNFLALLYAYRNNGYSFVDPSASSSALTRVIGVMSGVEMSYDNQIFMGHFNNFTIDEVAEKPFLFDYNFEFVTSSLSNDYSEVRGHFSPIPSLQETAIPPRTLNDIDVNLNSPPAEPQNIYPYV